MTDPNTALTTSPAGGTMVFGQTNLRPQDLVLPRVKVVQQMAKEAADKKAEPGDLYNTLTGENYGPGPIRIQPIQTFMQRILLVREQKREKADLALAEENLPPLAEGDGLLCRSYDMFQGRGTPGIECNECPLSKWTTDGKGKQVPPLCTETYNVAGQNELGELLILSFSRSSARVGKRFFSAVRFATAGAAPWTRIFDVSTHAERNDLGNFYVPDFAVSKDRPESELIVQAARWAEQLGQAGPIDVTPDDDDTEPSRPPIDDDPEGDSPF